MKIRKLNEDIQHCWFGYYLDIKGNKKYFYMTKDSTSKDADEASEIMEDSIPEPFTKFVFQGSVANTQAEKQGMKLIESKELEENIEVGTIADYITDHYDFDDIDDKYSCINSIKDSHKDTISKEELEQFIGSHNGKDKINESTSIKESATHCVYFTQDGMDQVEFEGTEDECNKYVSDIQAEQDDEFGDEAPERFIRRLGESLFRLNEALFREDYSDDVVTLSRYLDVEVPDICNGVLDLIEHLPSHKIVYITKICRDFYAKMESIIKNYTMTDDNFDESLKEHIMADIPQDVSEEEHLKSLIGAKVEFRNKYMNRMSRHTGVITGIDNSGSRLKANVHWEFDDINNPYDLEFLGSVNYLADRKTVESLQEDVTDVVTDTLSGPTEGPESGLASLLNTAVQDEFKTIQMYNDIAVSARAEGFEDIATVVDEINTEENKHVGQLQELLKTVSPNAKAIDTGEIEGSQQIDEVEDIVTEDINNSNSSPNNNSEEDLEDKDMKESWEEVYQSFKTIEKELNGDGEAITATIDQLYRDNKGNPDYETAYKKWASGD